MKVDPEVITMPTLSNMKEGVSLLMYYLGNKPKVHDAFFHALYLLNKNLEILLIYSKQSNVNVAL